ncbi:MAG: hypothetical protein HQ574_01045, partial [Chloroflexi bacterium]|nr:hypothetical protein [Chloroflexota bacterium]
MTKNPLSPPRQGEPWHREQLVEILGVAAAVNDYSFIRKAALGWLAVYPGDLPIQLIHAQAVARTLKTIQAFALLEKICLTDPEYVEAQQMRFEVATTEGNRERIQGEYYSLAPNQRAFRNAELKEQLPGWSQPLAKIRASLAKDDFEGASMNLPGLLGANPQSPLAAVTHLELLVRDNETPDLALRQLAEHYQKQFPDCLLPQLILADSLVKGGQSDRGVSLIHKAASLDITGLVANRAWGENHPYQNLWPEQLEAHLDILVPAAVNGALGWNQLPAGDSISGSEHSKEFHSFSETLESKGFPTPETLIHIEDDLDFAGQKKETRSIGKFPMYIVFSTRKGLVKKYGPETAAIVIEEMKKTTYAIRLKPGWGSVMLLADDPSSMANFGLKPTLSDDPWALKLALADLDRVLNLKGLMIGALLIIGGPDVVPYHKLPNPVADVDAEVPSDNPYGTMDENYFIPEWPVGRLPGGAGSDPGLLLDMLRNISEHHMGKNEGKKSIWELFLAWLKNLFAGAAKHDNSFGYVAEAWKSASQDVFKTIQDRGDLVTSPPYGKDTEIPVPITRYGYFNLHGVEDSPEWFGQKDFTNGSAGPDYPVALRPQDINAYDDAPLFVFTEACYGAHLKGREIDDSISLKCLSRGSHAVIGSSVTAYGSVSAPLIAADLLAEHFWGFISKGIASGIALQRAKIALAREMNDRQGYLDGEDQKTLISFLHFGDPLASPSTAERKQPKMAVTPRETPAEVKTVCDRSNLTTDIPSATLMHVKHVVKRYLPGMEDAEMVLSTEKEICSGDGHNCATAQFGGKVREETLGQRHVVTLSKQYEIPQNSGKTSTAITP